MRLGVVVSHPIQYHAPWFRALASHVDLHVLFAQGSSSAQHAIGGYGAGFEWDIDLLGGYESTVVGNVAAEPSVHRFGGCDTPALDAAIRSHAFDAVVLSGWGLKCYLQGLYACRRQGVPALVRGDSQLVTPRSRAKRVAKELAYPLLLHAYSACLYVGERNRAYLEHYRVRPDRLFHVPHAVDNEWFAKQARAATAMRQQLRDSWGVRRDAAVALFVGRLVESKRPLDLVRAAAKLGSESRIVPVFVGTGRLEQAVVAEARTLGVEVKMLGFRNQSELPAVYAAADFLSLPSSGEETWGLVVNEAMACGLPAVVSRAVGCAPDLVDSERTGETHEAGDIDALALAMHRLKSRLGSDQVGDALRAKMSKYSMTEAVRGTLSALRYVTTRCSEARRPDSAL